MEENKVHNIDIEEGLRGLASESVNLVLTDPPYNIDYKYAGYDDNRTDYWAWHARWVSEIHRVLKKDGCLFLKQHHRNIGQAILLLERAGFHYQNIIIWKNSSNFPPKNRFQSGYEAILFYTKSEKGYKFHRYAETKPENDRTWIAGDKGKLKGQFTDLWDDIKPIFVGACSHPEAMVDETGAKIHSCQMPEALARRIIKFTTNEGDLVVDPFFGSGTTIVAAKQLARRYVGFDIVPKYVELAKRRLKQETLGWD